MTKPDSLIDPARARFRAAQTVAVTPGAEWEAVAEVPAGEVLWREDGDMVVLTPDGWLVYVNRGKAVSYIKRARATKELVAAIRGT